MIATFTPLKQPGNADPVRIESMDGPALELAFSLEPGMCLRDALVKPLREAGLEGATVRIENLALRLLF